MPDNAIWGGIKEAEETGQTYDALKGTFRPRVGGYAKKVGQRAGGILGQRAPQFTQEGGVPTDLTKFEGMPAIKVWEQLDAQTRQAVGPFEVFQSFWDQGNRVFQPYTDSGAGLWNVERGAP